MSWSRFGRGVAIALLSVLAFILTCVLEVVIGDAGALSLYRTILLFQVFGAIAVAIWR